MATTTNYGWTTPDDTALVKDGAAAIRTLGSSVDTTTKALNPSTTLGDIEYRSSTANTNTRLGIGTTGQVLSVSGGVPAWATVSSGGMTLLDTVSLSGTSTLSNTFSSSYKQILVYVSGLYASTESQLQIRLNGDTGSNYSWVLVDAYSGTSTDASTASSVITIGYYGSSSSALQTTNGIITIMRPTDTTEVFVNSQFLGRAVSALKWSVGNGIYNNSAAITSITFKAGSGTFTAGTAYIYGVN
jgi:hypothetical protein